jgi:hypothetical protein
MHCGARNFFVIPRDGRYQFPNRRKTLKMRISQSSGSPRTKRGLLLKIIQSSYLRSSPSERISKRPGIVEIASMSRTCRTARFENCRERADRVERIEDVQATEMKSLTVTCPQRKRKGPLSLSIRQHGRRRVVCVFSGARLTNEVT